MIHVWARKFVHDQLQRDMCNGYTSVSIGELFLVRDFERYNLEAKSVERILWRLPVEITQENNCFVMLHYFSLLLVYLLWISTHVMLRRHHACFHYDLLHVLIPMHLYSILITRCLFFCHYRYWSGGYDCLITNLQLSRSKPREPISSQQFFFTWQVSVRAKSQTSWHLFTVVFKCGSIRLMDYRDESMRKSRDTVRYSFVVVCVCNEPMRTVVLRERHIQIWLNVHWPEDIPPIKIPRILYVNK